MLTQEEEVDNKSKKQETQENNIQLIAARSNTTKPFDPAEKTLDLVPSLVKLCAQAPKRRGVLHHTAKVSSRRSWAERPAPNYILPQDDVLPLHNRPYPSTIYTIDNILSGYNLISSLSWVSKMHFKILF